MTSHPSIAGQLAVATSAGASRAPSDARVGATGEELKYVRDPFRMLIVALTIVSVSRVHMQLGLQALRPALLLVLAAATYAYLYPRTLSRANLMRYWPMRRVAVLGVLACFSVGFGISLGRSATFILDSYSKTLLYCFLLALAIRGVRDLYTLMWAYVISCGIMAFLSLFVFQVSTTGGGIARLGDMHTFDANDVCVVLLVGLAFTMLLLHVARGSRRYVLWMILFGIGGTIARSGSRGGFIGLVAFAVAAVLLLNTISIVKKAGTMATLLLGLVTFAPAGYWEQMETILRPKEDYNYTSKDGRKAVAERGMGYMMQYPLFGLGIHNFQRAECTLANKGRINGPMRCTAPHNSYVQAGAEMGIPGLVVWTSLIFGGIASMIALRRRLPRAWRHGTDVERFLYNSTHYIALALAGFSASSFFVSFAWLDIIYIVAALMTGLYVSIERYRMEASAVDGQAGAGAGVVHRQQRPGWRVDRSIERMARVRRALVARPT